MSGDPSKSGIEMFAAGVFDQDGAAAWRHANGPTDNHG